MFQYTMNKYVLVLTMQRTMVGGGGGGINALVQFNNGTDSVIAVMKHHEHNDTPVLTHHEYMCPCSTTP